MWSRLKKSNGTYTPAKLILHLPIHAMTIYHPVGRESGPPPFLQIRGSMTILRSNDHGDHKYRGMRTVLRSVSVLNLGPGREEEIDVFSEETVMTDIGPPPYWPDELKKDNFHVMDEASDDCAPGTEIRHYLIVQIIGQDPDPTIREPHLSTLELEKHNHHIPFPPTPADTPLLEHSATAIRQLYVVHNPFAPGEPSILDETSRSVAPDLGIVDIQCSAVVFTVAGLVSLDISLPCPSPKTTVFAFTALVRQTQTLKSPRDGFETTSTKEVPFFNIGTSFSTTKPDELAPALWRGLDAGGNDQLPWSTTVESRFPHSCDSRASTLPGIASPITLKHAIVYHVLYSVYGEAADGSPQDGPGELRRLKVSRKVVFPSCRLTQPSYGLPQYASGDQSSSANTTDRSYLARYYANKPCPNCGRGAVDNACMVCPEGPKPHVRHEPGFGKICSVCPAAPLIPIGEPDHVKIGYCACVDWMKWRISPGGAKQLSSAAEAGDIMGKQIEGDRVLASKLDTEERARKASDVG